MEKCFFEKIIFQSPEFERTIMLELLRHVEKENVLVIFEMSGFTPYWILAFVGTALLEMSVFYPTRNFRQFWADPTFSAVRGTFLAEEEAQSVEI